MQAAGQHAQRGTTVPGQSSIAAGSRQAAPAASRMCCTSRHPGRPKHDVPSPAPSRLLPPSRMQGGQPGVHHRPGLRLLRVPHAPLPARHPGGHCVQEASGRRVGCDAALRCACCGAPLCHAMPHSTGGCDAALCHAVPRCATLCHAALRCAAQCCALLGRSWRCPSFGSLPSRSCQPSLPLLVAPAGRCCECASTLSPGYSSCAPRSPTTPT